MNCYVTVLHLDCRLLTYWRFLDTTTASEFEDTNVGGRVTAADEHEHAAGTTAV
jgi:hypothetical protein